jgi:hypothetical protein
MRRRTLRGRVVRTGQKRDRRKQFPERYVPADGSVLVDERLGYLIAGFTEKGDVAHPGERFHNAMWSRDTSGTCSGDPGGHAKCAHRAGGPHERGCTVTGADGEPHVWRCGCACHGHAYEPPPVPRLGQLELFLDLVPA